MLDDDCLLASFKLHQTCLKLNFSPDPDPDPASEAQKNKNVVLILKSPTSRSYDDEGATSEFKANYEMVRAKVEDHEKKIIRWLEAKKTSLPEEPPEGDDNAMLIHLKYPGGIYSRRFLISDRLSDLFNFVITTEIFSRNSSYRLAMEDSKSAFTERQEDLHLMEIGFETRATYSLKPLQFSTGELILFSKKEVD